MNILVTGAAGFIGYSLAARLLARGDTVLGLDNLNDYYDVGLKEARLARLRGEAKFSFTRLDIADRAGMTAFFAAHRFDAVVHLAAQAGVRYSVTHPYAYIDANLTGFAHVLEGVRQSASGHLIYASSSSVYGANTKLPFAEGDNVDHPVSLYAATKKANELMAHSYAHLYGLACTGLRFFTVYGPWGRPDMSPFKFASCVLEGKPIPVFNEGRMSRDFTYIDDIVGGIMAVLDKGGPESKGQGGEAPYRLYNIGNNQPVPLLRYIEAFEKAIGKKAVLDLQPMQPGDVPDTYADTQLLEQAVDFRPDTEIDVGVRRFVDWYRDYYRV
ncbi:MAG: NAD-dependent epimerase [Betaproteobacteria bacterium]